MSGVATAHGVDADAPAAHYTAASNTCAAMPLRTTGTVHYFCDCQAGAQTGCVPGSDANASTKNSLDCKNPAAPCQTWNQVATTFSRMAGGDTVALCKGGAFNVTANNAWQNARCGSAYPYTPAQLKDPTNATVCDVRDYRAPWRGSNKPLVHMSGTQFAINKQGYYIQRGVRVLNIEFRGGDSGPGEGTHDGTRGIFTDGTPDDSSHNATDWLVCNDTFAHSVLGIQHNGNHDDRFHVWGNTFSMNSGDAILGGPSHSTVDANLFDNNGSYNVTTHSMYLGYRTSHLSVTNNRFLRSANMACLGTMLVMHGTNDHVTVENNTFDCGSDALGGYGLQFSPSGSGIQVEGQTYITIRRNWLQNIASVGIDGSGTSDWLVEDNVVVVTNGHGIVNEGGPGDNNPGGPNGDRWTVRNNTIYYSSRGNDQSGINMAGASRSVTAGHIIANNAIVRFGSAAGSCMHLLGHGLTTASYAFVNNNLCYGMPKWESTTASLATWQANTGLDTASMNMPPQFLDPPTIFTPAAGSPLTRAGDAAHASSTDLLMKARPAPPSIGAFEP